MAIRVVRFLGYSGGGEGALKLKQHWQRCQVSNALTAFLKLWFPAYKKSFEKNQTLKLSGVVPICNPRTQRAKAEELYTPEASLA